MGIKIDKTSDELWLIAQEINKKEMTKNEVCKKYGISARSFTDLIRDTPIRYKSNKEGYIWDENKAIGVIRDKKVSVKMKKVDTVTKKEVKPGRPRKYTEGHTELKKLTLEIDKTVYNALQFKKITEGIIINKYIENLLSENIEPVYFDTVDKLNK
ncbi:hypothetical protein [Clostridium botulinum]|uniref:hypothetical protein n=1 Tax=Clostridium botulinum TaxID=1491 RepID=UPI00016B9D05|nr:hypothetical protein [Clostridium botulinum]EDT83639.1 hypothetical protein CBB_A0011 [Clostridium botulinum Bf]NEZ88437.1 hypothetical protein [Clostridium botulinum]WCJ75386.1 hypothetical protein MHB86_004024 [Clostridium botulinum]WCJ79225.1 hypothetical protein MHI66_004024 [Clostridium botulinum]WCJ83051.1 hypothetical protein MHI65_004009 [Clostridium botulinum]